MKIQHNKQIDLVAKQNVSPCLSLGYQISVLNVDSIRDSWHGSLREHEGKTLFWIRCPTWGSTVETAEGGDTGVVK